MERGNPVEFVPASRKGHAEYKITGSYPFGDALQLLHPPQGLKTQDDADQKHAWND